MCVKTCRGRGADHADSQGPAGGSPGAEGSADKGLREERHRLADSAEQTDNPNPTERQSEWW